MSKIYLEIALPKIAPGVPLEISRSELDFLLNQNLLPHERRSIFELRKIRDIINTTRWFHRQPLLQQGTISIAEFELALLQEEKSLLPPIVFTYLQNYREPEDRKRHSDALLRSFLGSACTKKTQILDSTVRAIYEIEHLSRVILKGLRLQEKNSSTPEAEADYFFNTSPAAHSEWPEPYRNLYSIWNECKHTPMRLNQSLTEWKFNAFQSILDQQQLSSLLRQFTIRNIIVYCAQYDLIELENKKRPSSCASFIDHLTHL